MAATLKDVARRAQVGVASASYVLSGTGLHKISAETQERIQAAAKALNYRTNLLGKALKSGKTMLVGAVFPAVVHSFVPEILQGLEDTFNAAGYSIVLCTYRNAEELRNKAEVLRRKQVDGVVVLPEANEEIVSVYRELSELCPLGLVGGDLLEGSYPFVRVDGERLGEIGTDYLLDRGHRRIVFMQTGGTVRLEGYRRSLECRGIAFDESLLWHHHHQITGGAEAFLDWLLAHPRKPTAIFASSDVLAAEIIARGSGRGVAFPEEFSIIGTDGLPLGNLLHPRLTSVSQPRYEQGTQAAEQLLARLAGHEVENTLLFPSILEGESVKNIQTVEVEPQ